MMFFSSKSIPQEDMFVYRFSRKDSVLKPDMTIPIARVATKLKENVWPAKIFYVGNTFSFSELGGGKQKEYTQAVLKCWG